MFCIKSTRIEYSLIAFKIYLEYNCMYGYMYLDNILKDHAFRRTHANYF